MRELLRRVLLTAATRPSERNAALAGLGAWILSRALHIDLSTEELGGLIVLVNWITTYRVSARDL